MKKHIKTIAALLLIGSLSTSCQKESSTPASRADQPYAIAYSSQGDPSRCYLQSNEDLRDFLLRMAALAEEGYSVCLFSPYSPSSAAAKATLTFSTSNKEEAVAWCLEKMLQGYTVTMEYNEQTHLYNCTATK